MTSDDLQRFIDAHQIQATILPMDTHTPTVPEAAKALGVETHQIIKSLVFMVRDEPILIINNGQARVDRRKIATYLEVGRNRVKFANAEKALEITGYVVGSMPPFGHKHKLRTLVDKDVTEISEIFGGGGEIDAMMRLTPAELLNVTAAEVVKVSE